MKETYFGLRFIATSKETDGQYFLSETIVPSRDPGPPLHFHANEDEGFYVRKGRFRLEMDGVEYILSAGEFKSVPKGVIHSWSNPFEEAAELTVIFTPAGIERMFQLWEAQPEAMQTIAKGFGTEFINI